MAKRRAMSQTGSLIPDQKKSRIDPIYLFADNMRHTVRKLSTRATTLLNIAPQSEVLSQSYGAPKLRESELEWFRDSHLGIPGKKSYLDVRLVERCKIYYKGEGGGFPKIRAVVSFVCPCCPWLILAPKVLQLCTNHLVWVVCKPVWMSEACQLFLVPSQSFNMPLYPSKCSELENMPWFLPLPLSCTWIHFWVSQGVGSASLLPLPKLTQIHTLYIYISTKCMHTSFFQNFKVHTLLRNAS